MIGGDFSIIFPPVIKSLTGGKMSHKQNMKIQGGEIGRRNMLGRVAGLTGFLMTAFFSWSAPAAAQSAGTVTFRNYTISVSDLDRSIKFYTEIFGFTLDQARVKVGPAIDKLVELQGVDGEFQMLMKDGARLQLIQYKSPPPVKTGKRTPVNQIGLTQHGLFVSDMEGALEAVAKMGGTVIEGSRLKGPDGKTRVVFVTDPDGTRIELLWRPAK